MIRTLVITTKLPYPPIGGAALRIWQNITALMQLGEVSVFCIVPEQDHSDDLQICPPGISLWHVCPVKEPSLALRNKRRLEMLRALFSQTDWTTRSFYNPRAAEELDQLLTTLKPDLVIFEELWGCSYLPVVQRHKCQIIYDAHNAEAFLQKQLISEAQIRTRLRDDLFTFIQTTLTTRVEQRMLKAVDQVWACSQSDTELLKLLNKNISSTSVIPNGVDVGYYESTRLGHYPLPQDITSTPHILIFTATFSYHPNAVAAQLLIKEIYPQLKSLYPDCQLLLVGAKPTQLMQDAARQNPGIIVTGRVPDIRTYLSLATVAIVPLLQGSGTRLKILEAFASGLPVVSTTKGAEGIDAQNNVHLLIRDGVSALTTGVHELWQQPATCQKLSDAAYTLVQTNYSWEAIQSQIAHSLETLSLSSNCADAHHSLAPAALQNNADSRIKVT